MRAVALRINRVRIGQKESEGISVPKLPDEVEAFDHLGRGKETVALGVSRI